MLIVVGIIVEKRIVGNSLVLGMTVRVLVGVFLLVVFMDIVVCSVLYKVVAVVEYGEEYLTEDISGLDCFSDIIIGVWKVLVTTDGEDIEDVIDDINLVDIFTGTSDIISGDVIDAVIIVEISDVVSAVDMSCTDEDEVSKSEIIHCPVSQYLL